MAANDTLEVNKFKLSKIVTDWPKQLVIASLYVFFGYVIHYHFTSNGVASVVWWGSGLSLAVLLMGGRQYLWGIFLGLLVYNILVKDSLVGAVSNILASILEALVGYGLLTHKRGFSKSLNALPDYLWLILLGGAVASIVGACIGISSLLIAGLIGPANFWEYLLLWWRGDTLGVVLATPFIMACLQKKPEPLNVKALSEELLLIGIAFIMGQIIFLGWFNQNLVIVPKAFFMFLFITWIAIRSGIRPTTFALNMIATQALVGAYLEVGYFADEIAKSGLHNYWIYMMTLSLVGIVIAVYVNDIKQKESVLRANENHLRLCQLNGGIGTWEADLLTHKEKWSDTCVSLLGFPDISEPTFEDYLAAIHPDDRQHVIDTIQSHIEFGSKLEVEYRILVKGGIRWMRSVGQAVDGQNGRLSILRGVVQDITERKQSENDLRIAATAFESQEGMFITDDHNIILRVNRAFTNITGYSAQEVIGKNPSILKSGRQGTDFYTAMWNSIHKTGAWEGEIWNRRKNGEIYPEHLTITAVKDLGGIVTNYVATLTDITLSKAAADKIERMALYDSLTGLPNRQLLRDRLISALASSSRSGRKGALMFIDLDNFKTLNDTLGHDMGDSLLQQVAQRLERCVRDKDTVARLGGDEFVIMLEGLNEQTFEAAAQTEVIGNKIMDSLNRPYLLAMQDYCSSPSIGVTLFSGHEQSIDELLKQADIAMYQAKTSGRNALCFFDQQMQARITARVRMEADLRLALVENQFELYYQPQVLHNHRIIGAEILIRWQHPIHGLVPPADFIPLAEETGLIIPIGQWVLETACAQIKAWEEDPVFSQLQIAVNVSPRQFRQVDFVEKINHIIRRTAINPDRLKLELTESLLLDDIDDCIHKMNALREVGVFFSMDDFGTGHSSLSYLTQLPLDQLKIDRSFIHNIGEKAADAVIVQTIIGMSKNLGMRVIAEGVETELQRIFLERLGCQIYQGFLFSEPLPVESFESLFKGKQ